MKIEDRFINYVKYDTQSDSYSETNPSTMKQKELAKYLVEELHQLGIRNAMMNEFGEVYAFIDANCEGRDKIGFIAHMDTAMDCSGKNVNPRIVRDYDGSDIPLNEHFVLSPKDFSNLKTHLHEDLIVTDGTTLLGADDKAGIAIIMNMAEYLLNHPELKHGRIGIAFTCDEEIGRGADDFDLDLFDCDYAYTIDGGDINVISYENFNAYSAVVSIQGRSVHPGDAKGKMVNASLVGMEFHECLDPYKNPAITEGYEGFYHLIEFNGQCESAKLTYILRNHDEKILMSYIDEFKNAQDFLNKKYHDQIVSIEFKEQYKNMRTIIEKDPRCINKAIKALEMTGLNPKNEAIRGGTDGANLTYEGLYCPNLGTGGANFHGKFEYVSIQNMEKMVLVLVNIVCQ
ncbi:MAG: peptidase T [Traorella sp.]